MSATRRVIVGLAEHADEARVAKGLQDLGAHDVKRHSPSLPAMVAVVDEERLSEFLERAEKNRSTGGRAR